MANDYMNLAAIAVIPAKTAVFPAQAGNQCHYKAQSSSSAQLDTRVREYDDSRTQQRTKQAESKQ